MRNLNLIAPKRQLAVFETRLQYRLTTSLLLIMACLALVNSLVLITVYPLTSITYLSGWAFTLTMFTAYWLSRTKGFEISVFVAVIGFLGYIGLAIFDQFQTDRLFSGTLYWLLPLLVFAGITLSNRRFAILTGVVTILMLALILSQPIMIEQGFLRPVGVILSVCGLVWYASRLREDDRRQLQQQAVELKKLNQKLDDQLMIKALEVTLVNDERLRTEQALRAAQRLQTVGVSASSIAHDFRNLVAAARMQIELSLRHLDEDHRAFRHSMKANDTLLNTISLINQLLVYTGELESNVSEVELTSFAHQTCEALRLLIPSNVSLVHDLEDAPPLRVQANPAQLQQVIMNLVINASEAIDGGGKVYVMSDFVSYSDIDEPNFTHGNERWVPGDYAVLRVSDDGCGMSLETQRKIFDPFFSTKAKEGRGLGMAAILSILEEHKALLMLDSEEGVGTTFCIFLPHTQSVSEADSIPMLA